MSKLPSTFERNRLRQYLIRLGSLLVLTLLACGLISQFSLWSMQRQHVQSEARQSELLKALNSARTAQVSFKIQVQSWKNLLLRGSVQSDYDGALHEFDSAARATRDNLADLSVWAAKTGNKTLVAEVDDLLTKHAQAVGAYQAALPASGSMLLRRDLADAAVRGIDRPINGGLDRLVVDMLRADLDTRTMIKADEMQRFDLLTRTIWASMGISLLLVSVLLWRTLRDPALRG